MKNIEKIGKACCGCHGCEHSCPVQAISFVQDEEGFTYPSVSESCIRCGKCLQHCPIETPLIMGEPISGFAAYLKNRQQLRSSSSGGVFMAAAEAVLDKDGVVFGCGELTPGNPAHIAVSERQNLRLLQGSKYVQSDISGVYRQVIQLLKQEKYVLFTGTPCQVAGLLRLTGKHERLYTMDIVCHGVPSRKMYRAYLHWLERKAGAAVKEFHFRSKVKHDWSLTYRVKVERNGKVRYMENIATLSPYYSHFLKGMDYRESCYQCPFARRERVSDLTVGDFWGIETVLPELHTADGVSAVLVNTERGRQLWQEMMPAMVVREVPAGEIIANNGQLNAPTKRPVQRDEIYALLERAGYDYVAKAYINKNEIVVDGIKNVIPNRIRQKVKSILKKLRYGRRKSNDTFSR